MKRHLLSLFVVATFIAYALQNKVQSAPVTPVPTEGSGSITDTTPNFPNQPQPTPTPAISPPVNTNSGYKDGTFTGQVADAYYGYVQIQATITGGQVTDVSFLQYPNERRTSEFINRQAMPYLIQEALQSQSAQVDIVTGATQTSRAFRESLTSALAQAHV